jgi:hypothetical protein
MTRNIFDQYKHYENRLTHALLCTLTHDRNLLSRFLRHYAKDVKFNRRMLTVAEQTIPGNPEPTTHDDFYKALPDGVIFEHKNQTGKPDDKQDIRRALIIESKITSPLTRQQLERHSNRVHARGFEVSGLAISADAIRANLPDGWSIVSWSDLYGWLLNQPRQSIWSTELARFYEVLEAQMVADGSLGDRTLTRFNGIPFGSAHPYNLS